MKKFIEGCANNSDFLICGLPSSCVKPQHLNSVFLGQQKDKITSPGNSFLIKKRCDSKKVINKKCSEFTEKGHERYGNGFSDRETSFPISAVFLTCYSSRSIVTAVQDRDSCNRKIKRHRYVHKYCCVFCMFS